MTGEKQQRISFRQTAWVHAYIAFGLTAINLLLFEPALDAQAWRWVFAALLVPLLAIKTFDIPWPGFRLGIQNAAQEDMTNRSAARVTVLWGLIWRAACLFFPLSILYGLSGAVIVWLMQAYPQVVLGYAIYPVFFVCFFTGIYVSFFGLTFWWLRMGGLNLSIVAVRVPPTSALA